MLKEDSKAKVKEFMSKNMSPSITIATTLKEGYAVCIPPMIGICGPEIMVHPNTKPFLVDFINSTT